jgi:hypothetical protein
MCLEDQPSGMSAEGQSPMGMRHMTVVPENFDTVEESDVENDGE